jgi:hypothetical protein
MVLANLYANQNATIEYARPVLLHLTQDEWERVGNGFSFRYLLE